MSFSKQKGYRGEVGIVKRWIAAGIECRRVILSGALGHILGDEYFGDVKALINGQSITIQSKCLAKGWTSIYRDLSNHDCLIIKATHKESLVILPESLFLTLVGDSRDGATSVGISSSTE